MTRHEYDRRAWGTPGYEGRHRQVSLGFAPSGRISDRIRSEPELLELEQRTTDRGGSNDRSTNP